MKRLFLIFFVSCFFVGGLLADLPFRDQRRDMFRVLPIDDKSIVFMGNSITQGNEWSEAFGNDPRIVNRGISGNTSAEILNNMDYVLSAKPAKLFLMIGINDGAAPDIVLPATRGVIELTQRESPLTEIYIQSILPYGGRAIVWQTNSLLKSLCAEKNVTYVDVFANLGGTETNLSLNGADSNDGLHLLGSGYRKWLASSGALTGLESAMTSAANLSIPSAHANYVNQRLSMFGLMPTSTDDILMLGDFHVNTAEWRELLRNPHVKNRGIGVGHGGSSISLIELKAMAPQLVKGQPAKVFISCGYKDLDYNGQSVQQAANTYSELIAAIRTASPATVIYMQSLVPSTSTATNANKYVALNAEIKKLVNEDDQIYFIDVYAALQSNGVLTSTYGCNNGGINGRGYLKWVELIAPWVDASIQPVSVASYDLQIALADARKNLYNLKEGDTAGAYPEAVVSALRSAIADAEALVRNPEATDSEYAASLLALSTALSAVSESPMQLPKLSDSNTEYWYKLSAPLRSSKYVTGTGAGLSARATNNYKPQQWKFVLRADNSWNIVNRADASFISPASAVNTQILTTSLEPATGWTLKPAAGFSYFIITSNQAQLNLTTFADNMIYNWGGGANIDDVGCQFSVSEVSIDPDEEPELIRPQAFLQIFHTDCAGIAPVKVPAADAAKVFARDTLTVAIDFTPSNTTGDAVLVSASNADDVNKFFGIGTIANFTKTGVRFVGDNGKEGWYTMAYPGPTARHQLVITMSPGASNYNYYIGGAFLRNVSGMGEYGYYNFAKIPNPTLYLGGVASANDANRYPFTGTLHSVQFFDGVLSAEEVVLIDYSDVNSSVPTVSDKLGGELPFTVAAKTIVPKPGVQLSIYDIAGRKVQGAIANSGYYIVRAQGKSYKVLLR